MDRWDFKIGQLLSIADDLQSDYCQDVRGGSMPASFIGSEFIHSIFNNPRRGFSLLNQRIMVYMKWARVFAQRKIDNNYVGFHLHKWNEIYGNLDCSQIPSKCTDENKIIIAKGYYCGTKKEKTEGDKNEQSIG